jgi:hypothetical protein
MLAIVALALAYGGSASAATIHLGWVEKLDKGPALRVDFRVGALQTNGRSWTATIEITNRSTGKLAVARSQFGIVEFATKTDFSRPTRFLRAVAFDPKLPTGLAPGAHWKGTIGGAGTPNEKRYVRLLFGPFSTPALPSAKPFTWITDHADHVFALVI